MESFIITNKEELGSYLSLEVIKLEDVIFCPEFITSNNVHLFNYTKTSSNNLNIYPVGESIITTSSPKFKSNGILYNVKSSFEILRPTKELDIELLKNLGTKVILKANKHNGSSILYGSVNFPLLFSYEILHSKKIETPSKVVVNISGKTPQNHLFI